MVLLKEAFRVGDSFLTTLFTFQYGSIKGPRKGATKQYVSEFTFQYGSIKGANLSPVNHQQRCIYIPIWFY